jgi:hypothetical protein
MLYVSGSSQQSIAQQYSGGLPVQLTLACHQTVYRHSLVPMMQLSQGVVCSLSSSWMAQRVAATDWAKQHVTCEDASNNEAKPDGQGKPDEQSAIKAIRRLGFAAGHSSPCIKQNLRGPACACVG